MKATLTTLTPVHIGNGTTYNKNIDFIQTGKNIGIVDEEKVLQIIGEENIHQWVASINKGGDAFILLLKQRGWTEDKLDAISSRIDNLINLNNKSTQLKEIYRTPIKGITIPGSSIKGSIKTAVLNSFMSNEFLANTAVNDLKKWKEKKDPNTGKLIPTNVKWSDAKIDKKIFGQNANEKSTRFLKVFDAHFGEIQANVYEMQILDAFHDGWRFKQGQQVLLEAIPSGSIADIDITIDTLLLNKNRQLNPSLWSNDKMHFLLNGINGLCKIVNDFTKSLIKYDYNSLKEESLSDAGITMLNNAVEIHKIFKTLGENEMILRVGGNSGYLFTTGQWVENKGFEISPEDFQNLRKNIQKRDYSDMDIWPKTRKISTDGQVFGFVKIKFHD
ncbi:MAG TPA: type III-A CRISPR-associated RAMP protein Csm5 [Bacteroidales bacterium]|nr:type III-A CRISPR-associated RAMP protein Csm5 [Bacteroidales bacterium]